MICVREALLPQLGRDQVAVTRIRLAEMVELARLDLRRDAAHGVRNIRRQALLFFLRHEAEQVPRSRVVVLRDALDGPQPASPWPKPAGLLPAASTGA